jgi:Tfp pilus assembly protein PilE
MKGFQRTGRPEAGLSLIELLAVVAVILNIATIAIPNYIHFGSPVNEHRMLRAAGRTLCSENSGALGGEYHQTPRRPVKFCAPPLKTTT